MAQDFGEFLVSSGSVSPEALRDALVHTRGGQSLTEVLVRTGAVEEVALFRKYASFLGLPYVDLAKGKIRQEILDKIPADFAASQGVLPATEKDGRLIVVIDDPLKRILVDQLQFQLGQEVACALATPTALKRALAQYYGAAAEEDVARSMGTTAGEEGDDAPIIRLVSRMFQDALAMRASDIHVEPAQGALRVRYRVDGVLRVVAEHPPHLSAPLISRLKIMAAMDIAEKRKPQDGRIGLDLKGKSIDVRCSILPTNHGESVVMRLLDRSSSLIGLRELGFEEDDYKWFKRVIARPNGIVLVTGPTGSGKTTSLYAALSELNRPDVKIITAEDPVEYHIKGINQVQVTSKIGLTFGRVLRAMLRAAPNIILVGEIRDLETAEIAIQASLTGHLVFSTLHTNDAPSALTRLIDMGVKPFLVSAAVQAVMAQRLVRRLCKACAQELPASEAELRALGLDAQVYAGRTLRQARGCRECENTGYRGRVGIFELLEMDDVLRDMTFRGASLEDVRATAISSRKLKPLIVDGARKVLAGSTTVTEVLRVTRAGDAK
jgi:type IV pilus assembly protein PilB